ncbi:bifunctional 3,4-dihydroxy-2-butanone-4-phosphate synthase/GTP cyclohydrolase II [Secundilactobacillus similis DSM 23365 = JCM 2765]|uniref:GTP cyclohydrolase-2 n=1 Tax=Secundilactobacillus similis DSM 23365 = JCM 2765 TaxID=1423804 RepID=A0A0R2F9P6_9LACO|nr:bifunctional 3,4-dihydroxy-2-butanone-4-phosphate synthase/GTP cyclohydrolase II [Secundilactobacillus similis]KRN25011.1 GTP cyclohydrolase II [Secundilactobacillus similis DSM 23365 = JCM 2765]
MIDQDVISTIEAAVDELKQGKLIIVADSLDREAEGDLLGLADYVTPENVNRMVTKARGLLCVPMSAGVAERLGLKPMVSDATDAFGTAFTVSVDARTTSTGISAFDRSDTIAALANGDSTFDDFYHPGHIFPLIARENGVLERDGHTEAAVDLARLTGGSPVAYICEVLKKDGTMARRKDLKAFAEGTQTKMITIGDLIRYRQLKTVDAITTVDLPTDYGHFKMEAFKTSDEGEPTLLISKGDLSGDVPVLLRLHSECLTGDVFGSKRCDCGAQLHEALRRIEAAGRGAVLYLRQEGRGIGLANKLKAYKLQEQGFDTVEANLKLGLPADDRNYGLAAAILRQKGVTNVDLMTNNPDKIEQLEAQGIHVHARQSLEVGVTTENEAYLKTKKQKFHHMLKEVI